MRANTSGHRIIELTHRRMYTRSVSILCQYASFAQTTYYVPNYNNSVIMLQETAPRVLLEDL